MCVVKISKLENTDIDYKKPGMNVKQKGSKPKKQR